MLVRIRSMGVGIIREMLRIIWRYNMIITGLMRIIYRKVIIVS